MHLTSYNKEIVITSVSNKHIQTLWEISFGPKADLQWRKFNGPYFNDPILDLESFKESYQSHAINNPHRGVISYQGNLVGELFANWVDGDLKQWLEFGILIYPSHLWGKKIGQTSLKLWIDYLFQLHPHIQRIGFTTWSKNKGMMGAGEKLNMIKEANIRKVRFYENQYYDSIKYGILREEFYNTSK